MYLTLVDLSEWNGPTGGHPHVDFNQLMNNVDGYILKASGGDGKATPLYRDAELTYNQQNARATGKPVGYYHFAGGGDPVKEADWFLAQVGGLREGEFLVDDFEINHSNPGSWCGQFYNRIHDVTGVWAMQYSPRALMQAIYPSVPQAGKWVADPDDSPDGTVMYNGKPVPYIYVMQQFVTAIKPGVEGLVDLNAFFYTGDKDQATKDLLAYGFHQPITPPVIPIPVSVPEPTPPEPVTPPLSGGTDSPNAPNPNPIVETTPVEPPATPTVPVAESVSLWTSIRNFLRALLGIK